MEHFHAITLGIVQGIGEFLPISSSAHLILTPWFLGWPDHGLALDVALHLGTLISVLAYYKKTWIHMSAALLKPTTENASMRRLFFLMVVATIPGAIIGYWGNDYAETVFRSPPLIATTLSSMGFFLWFCDSQAKKNTKTIDQFRLLDALLIGISQGFAIVPGFSRAGTTISAALLLGVKREEAARFSFFLSVPIIMGAIVFKFPKLLIESSHLGLSFWLAVSTATIVGFVAIAGLMHLLKSRGYFVFVVYRLLISALILAVYIARQH